MALPTRDNVQTLDYSLGAQPAVVLEAKSLASGTLDYSLQAQPVFGLAPSGGGPTYSLTASYGSYSVTGQTATVSLDRVLTASYGAYSLTGQSATLTYAGAYVITAQSGSYSLTGQSATLLMGRLLSAQNGVYSVAGQAADIVVGGTPTPTVIQEYFIEIRSFTERRRF